MARLLMPSIFHYILVTTLLSFSPIPVHSLTFESDIQALRSLKHAIDPTSIAPTSYLSTWDFMADPCDSTGEQFLGILCNNPLENVSSRIVAIDIDAVGYDGFIAPSIGSLAELTILNLSKNRFRRTIPETISSLRKLTRLSLADNFLTGTIPDLAGLWQLNSLDLSSNQFYGYIPDLPVRLTTLSLSHNILSGHISPVRKLRSVVRLDLSDNRFSGLITEAILSLPRLVHLNISNNRFEGFETINFSGEDTQLQTLDAANNQLRGRLPSRLVRIQNLTRINLAHNQFSGPIPREYGDKLERSWRILYLDNNFLSGHLPSEFTARTKRVRGSLAMNCLRCPAVIPMCHGGQRPLSECLRQSR